MSVFYEFDGDASGGREVEQVQFAGGFKRLNSSAPMTLRRASEERPASEKVMPRMVNRKLAPANSAEVKGEHFRWTTSASNEEINEARAIDEAFDLERAIRAGKNSKKGARL